MADALFVNESATEYFKGMVESAMEHQHVAAHELTSFYVVNLLSGFARTRRPLTELEEPLGIRFVQALQSAGSRQRDGLREIGDLSLFTSGFFADSLNRGLVDIDYYIELGERAYGALARQGGDDTFRDVFDELAEKFTLFVDVLGEVSEQAALTSNSDLLRLYEKWVRTRSRRRGDLLIARGLVPHDSATTHVQ